MTIEIIIDPNLRIEGNRTFAEFTDVMGGFINDIQPGDRVIVVEEETDIIGDATVYAIDREKELIDLTVDWPSLRQRPAAEEPARTFAAVVRVLHTSQPDAPSQTTTTAKDAVLAHAG
ncbi:MAG: hypothetical protein WBZ37_29270 [Mycobacterium sp.]